MSLACALIHSPKILILDEPFTGLDIPTHDKLLSYMKDYAKAGNTILIATHDVEVINAISDHVALIKNGKLILNSKYINIKNNSENISVKNYLKARI